jgi:iron complex outermembrane receptor protein
MLGEGFLFVRERKEGMFRLRFIVLILGVILLISVNVFAQADTNEVELGRIVVTPARMPQEEYATGSNVIVIDSKEIADSNAVFIADILKEKAGINVFDLSTDKTAKVDIRGFADTSVNNILVLVNGRKVNSIDISGPDWIQIPIKTIDRIEVLRGAGSVLYGDNAVGGVINIITKKGKAGFSGKTNTELGSYRTYQENIELSGGQDKLSYYLFLKYSDTDGYRTNSDVLTKDWNARVGYKLSENLSFDVITGWHEDDYGMPGGLNDAGELIENGRRGSVNKSDYAETEDKYVQLLIDGKPQIADMDIGKFMVNIFYRNRDAYSWFDYGAWGATATKYKIDTQGVNTKYIHNTKFFRRDLDLVVGIDYYDVEHIIRGSGSGIMASTDDLTIYKEELGFYLFSDYELFNKLSFNSGVRYQRAKYRFDQIAATTTYETRHPSESVFMSGMKYEYAEGSNIHFSVQETFRFLATDEWFSTTTGLNTNLEQQTGLQYEIGVKHNFFDTLLLSMTPYWIDLKNEIYLNPDPAPGQNENYDRTRRMGVEFGAELDLLKLIRFPNIDDLSLYTNYTYQLPKFRGGLYKNNDIPMVPRHQANIGFKTRFLKNFNISLTGNYIGSRYAINDTKNEASKVKGYLVWDYRISYKKDPLEIYLGINNIFNRKYSSYVVKSTFSATKDYYPSPERNFVAGCSFKF